MQRHYTFFDKILTQIDASLNTVWGNYQAERKSPSHALAKNTLSDIDSKLSARLMRVNHSGEVCAQALYRGQLNFTRAKATQKLLEKASAEESDHLAWCDERLQELKAHRSYLNIFWYWNSYCLGALAAWAGDRWSLGFLKETELQVEQHLNSHLHKIPSTDYCSLAIVQQMKLDEAQHSRSAYQAGAAELPTFIKRLMRLCAKLMTNSSYFI